MNTFFQVNAAPPSAAASYAVFGGVLASAVVAGLMVQMAVRSNTEWDDDYPSYPLGLALALLMPSVLLFTALTGHEPSLKSAFAYLLPLVLLSAGGVLTFAGIGWVSKSTGGGLEELLNWRALSRGATFVAVALTWQAFGTARERILGEGGSGIHRHNVLWIVLLGGPILVSLLPGGRGFRRNLGGRPVGARVLRRAVLAFILVVVVLWGVVDEVVRPSNQRVMLDVLQIGLAASLGFLFALFDLTLPQPSSGDGSR